MDCKFIQQHLFDYQQGKLPAKIRENVESHAEGCEACREMLKRMQAVHTAIASEKAMQPDAFAGTRIMQFIENSLENRKKPVYFVLRPAFLTISLLSAIFIGFAIGKISVNRVQGKAVENTTLENLRSDLYIHDFIDEGMVFNNNE